MDILEVINLRKSVRGYKKDAVPKTILEEIFNTASRSPSAYNTQPWEVTVITGDVLENIKQANIDKLNSGATPQREVALKPYKEKYRERQVALAVELFRLLGFTLNDQAKKNDWAKQGYLFFNAPTGLIISLDKSLDDQPLTLLDIGAFVQTLCLTSLSFGLATCIHDQGIMYPGVIRKFTDLSEHKRMIIAISIGYPDWDFPANRLKTPRESIVSFTSWYGFN
jgi:nitroreductase